MFGLILVLVSLGLLVSGLGSGDTRLVWGSIAASLAAGLVLLVTVSARRRTFVGATGAGSTGDAVLASALTNAPRRGSGASVIGEGLSAKIAGRLAEPAQNVAPEAPGESVPAGAVSVGAEVQLDAEGIPEDEPPEERAELTDSVLVVDLTDEVLVVDERPRYHLFCCDHLAGREAIPLPLREAREEGFTPCALCRPDTTVAAATRVRRGH